MAQPFLLDFGLLSYFFGKPDNKMGCGVSAEDVSGEKVALLKNEFCRKCGSPLYKEATFCSTCGTLVPDIGQKPTGAARRKTETWKEKEKRLGIERSLREEYAKKDLENYKKYYSTSELVLATERTTPITGNIRENAIKGLSLRGETEEQFRERQNAEREESKQRKFGMDLELSQKTEKKLEESTQRIENAMKWIEDVTGEKRKLPFPDCLKSGRVLCTLANAIWPGIIKDIHVRPITLLERENVANYLAASEKIGVRKEDLFTISDLYEEKYLSAVINNIYALSMAAECIPSFNGPYLSFKE